MKGDKKKTISHTSYGSYEFLAMFFGLTNAPAIFCTFTNDIFRKWFDDFVVVYMDEILAYNNSMEEHVEHFRKVFQRLREIKLYVKFEKCEFGVTETNLFGHKLAQKGLKMDDHKVKAILDWEPLRLVFALRSLLGLAFYYCKFIKKFTKIDTFPKLLDMNLK
jgi:hypothetical protein